MTAAARWDWRRAALLAAFLAALALLAHGCHGPDEDHELLTRDPQHLRLL